MAVTLAVKVGKTIHGGIMSEGQMILMFCVVYSGALTLAIWTSLMTRQRMQAHFDNDTEPAKKFRQGA